MIFFLFFAIILLIGVYIFASPTLSPIPYYPSNKKDKKLIIAALKLKNDQMIIDLGAGDGWVIFEAAKVARLKRLNTRFIAVDINPILFLIMNTKRLFHPNKKNIAIIQSDFLSYQFWKRLISLVTPKNHALNTVFYLYISPRFMNKTKKLILKHCPNARIVTYLYPFSDLTPTKILQGVKKVFVYKPCHSLINKSTSRIV